MSFGDAIATCFRKYAEFRGRATRPEFWWYFLFFFLISFGGLLAAAGASLEDYSEVPIAFVVWGIAALALVLPYWAAAVRRLHDTSRSGWYVFISLIPIVGTILLLVAFAEEGTPGPNQYGPPPGAPHPPPPPMSP